MKRLWILLAGVMLVIVSIPETGWAQEIATGITLSKNLLPDSLVGNNVNSIWIDANGDILAAIAYGGLYRSTDDGKTWERIFKGDFVSNFGKAVIREPKTNALLLGNGGGLYRSEDEGKSWVAVWPGFTDYLVIKWNGSVLADSDSGLVQSDDGGKKWNVLFDYSNASYYLSAITVRKKDGSIFGGTASAVGVGNGVLRSLDDGKSWQWANGGLENSNVLSIASDDSGVIYAGVEKKGLHRSTNDGATWEKIPGFDPSRQNVTEILVVKPDLVFVGFGWKGGINDAKGGVFKYDGREWTQIVADTAYTVMALAVKDNSLLVGTSSALYRVDGVIVGVEDEPNTIPSSFALFQNYPNPFNPSTTIEFSLPSRSHVRLSIWNVIGQEVAMLVSEEKPAGTHRVVWNPSASSGQAFPSGVYFSRLETSTGLKMVRKMLLMK